MEIKLNKNPLIGIGRGKSLALERTKNSTHSNKSFIELYFFTNENMMGF